MRKIIDYGTSGSNDLDTLDEYVKARIATGWQPLGGVSLSNGYALQAMVKYECEHEVGVSFSGIRSCKKCDIKLS